MTEPADNVTCCGAGPAWGATKPGQPLTVGCQLCPNSASYWRSPTVAPAVRRPPPDRSAVTTPPLCPPNLPAPLGWSGILDWSKNGPQGPASTGPPALCVMGCGQKTTLRSPKPDKNGPGGEPCHKVCAERWWLAHRRTPPGYSNTRPPKKGRAR